ncbi:uncharacterized protein LOC123542605 [Mercenaria mercenaria]|uniref:uncharacterized protein LOC123542605 n=1 Tax=Mercenaria mercenaria TaxID=6596 RepID=UPI00234F818D|nr:uncharacterized protein LOC123542605 [Mercenaria mercenaria]
MKQKMSNRHIHFKGMYIATKMLILTTTSIIILLIYLQLDLTLSWHLEKESINTSSNLFKSTCNGALFPVQVNTESNWGPVDQNRTIFVISAYYVGERERIFVIGSKPFQEVTVICQLWFTSLDKKSRSIRQTNAKVVAPSGATGYNYTSTIFECNLESAEQPTHVSLVVNSCENPLNLVKVREASKPAKYQRRFTVCLSPMFQFDEVFRLVEWIEFNRILGAEKFLLYNYSTGVNVEKVIGYYVNSGTVKVIQWDIPFPPENNIEYFAQKAALNDCIFRNKNVSEFVINIDKDEYVIPHAEDLINWSQMIKLFDKNYAGYLIRHTFFRLDWKIKNQNFSERQYAEAHDLVTLTHFEHEKKIWPACHRSKYFARTAYVEFGNIHEIPRGRIFTVPTNIALLHHYRIYGDPKQYEKVKDFTVLLKYGHTLTRNVQKIWKALSVSNNIHRNLSLMNLNSADSGLRKFKTF